MTRARAACCASPPKGVGDDATDAARATPPTSLRSVSTKKKKHTGPTSLRTLARYGSTKGADARDDADEEGARVEVADDPRAQYETAPTPTPVKPKFDPNKFKKRVGDHLAAKHALEAERRPLLEAAAKPADDAPEETSERRAKREAREQRKEAKRLAKEDKRKHREHVREARTAQKRCWWMLVFVVFAVIVCAGVVFGDGLHFNYWTSNDDRVDARDRTTRTPASEPRSTNAYSTLAEASKTGIPRTVWSKFGDDDDVDDDVDEEDARDRALDADGDAYDVDFNDPSLRTIAPKAWRKRERKLEKVKRAARSSAKDDVRRFVDGAHRELGVRDEVKDAEEEYEDGLIQRIESSPGVVVEKRRAAADATRAGDETAEVLAKSQASILSHGLVRDTKSSSRDLDALSFGDGVDAGENESTDSRAAAAGVAETGGDARASGKVSKKKRADVIEDARDDDDDDPDWGLSAMFRPPNEPAVHERQPDDDGSFPARRAPRRALAT